MRRIVTATLLAWLTQPAWGQGSAPPPAHTGPVVLPEVCSKLATAPIEEVKAFCNHWADPQICARRFEEHLDKTSPRSAAGTPTDADSKEFLRKQVASSGVPAFVGTLSNLLPGGNLLGGFVNDATEDPYTLGGGGATRPKLGEASGLGTDVAGLTDPEPRLNPAVREHLESTQRGQLADELERALDVGDNLLVQWRVAPEFWIFGRAFEQYAASFQQLAYSDPADATEVGEVVSRGGDDALANAIRGRRYDEPDVYGAVACYAALRLNHDQRWSEWKQRVHGSRFGQLINNQPQIVFTYRGTRPLALSGPEIDAYSVRLELGVMNSLTWFDWFSDGWSGDCDTRFGYRDTKCAKAFGEFVEEHDFMIGHDIRFMAGYERADIEDLEVVLPLLPSGTPPAPTLPVTVPGTESAIAGDREIFTVPGATRTTLILGLGGAVSKVNSVDQAKRSSRLDLIYQKEEFEMADATAGLRSDREIWRLTYTYRIGDISIPFNLLYRERAEYDVDVADDITGGVGIGYQY